ncbi:MAG: SH3 domain-containing protein [Chloroflexi bacterium]|nr:SH3 domain-containing protein [Chloroflexota bacterium]
MSAKQLLLLVAALLLAGLSLAQESGLPACSDGNLRNTMYGTADRFFSLYDAIDSARSVDDLLENYQKLVNWRGGALPKMLTCAENYEYVLRMSELTGDLLSSKALQRSGVGRLFDPLEKAFHVDVPRFNELQDGLYDMIDGGDRASFPYSSSHGLPACTGAARESLMDLISGFQALHASHEELEGRSEVLDYIEEVVLWRRQNLLQQPVCAEAIDIEVSIHSLIADTFALHAFRLAKVEETSNIAIGQVAQGAERLTSLLDKLIAEDLESAALSLPIYGSNFPTCSVAQFQSFADHILPHIEFLLQATELDTVEDLLEFRKPQNEFRDSTWSRMALCAETMEIGWWLNQLSADFAASRAYKHGRILKDNLYSDAKLQGAMNLGNVGDMLFESIPLEILADESTEVLDCSDDELQTVDEVVIDFQNNLMEIAFHIETESDLRRYSEAHLEWRERVWSALPNCIEGMQLVVTMNAVASDFAVAIGLDASGELGDDNPYRTQAIRNWASIMKLPYITALKQGSLRTYPIYYVTANPYANIRSCGSTECSIVGSAKYGSELIISDDTGSWYQIWTADGEPAFIAGFLTSSVRPGG